MGALLHAQRAARTLRADGWSVIGGWASCLCSYWSIIHIHTNTSRRRTDDEKAGVWRALRACIAMAACSNASAVTIPVHSRLKLGITTVCDGQPRFLCGTLRWCQDANRLRKMLEAFADTTTVIITRRARLDDCLDAVTVWNEELYTSAVQWVCRLGLKIDHEGRDYLYAVIMKLLGLALTSFDVVLFTDLDVVIAPLGGPSLSLAWEMSLRSLVNSSILFVGAPDHSAPINTGAWLACPRAHFLGSALHVLRNCNWTEDHGFCHVGSPRDIMAANGSRLCDQLSLGYAASPYKRLSAGIEYGRLNTWKFVGGSTDQGLFWYLIYVVGGVGTWSASITSYALSINGHWCAPEARHYWGHDKPWELVAIHRNRRISNLSQKALREMRREVGYLREVEWASSPVLGNASRCAQHFTLGVDLLQSSHPGIFTSIGSAVGYNPNPLLPFPWMFRRRGRGHTLSLTPS